MSAACRVQTILAARAISKRFPEITEMGKGASRQHEMAPQRPGRRRDDPALGYPGRRAPATGSSTSSSPTPTGSAWNTSSGSGPIARLGIPRRMEDLGSPDANHYTHVHISNFGGGFPKGGEISLGLARCRSRRRARARAGSPGEPRPVPARRDQGSLTLCAWVAGSSTPVTRIVASGNRAANSAMNGIEPPIPISTASTPHA